MLTKEECEKIKKQQNDYTLELINKILHRFTKEPDNSKKEIKDITDQITKLISEAKITSDVWKGVDKIIKDYDKAHYLRIFGDAHALISGLELTNASYSIVDFLSYEVTEYYERVVVAIDLIDKFGESNAVDNLFKEIDDYRVKVAELTKDLNESTLMLEQITIEAGKKIKAYQEQASTSSTKMKELILTNESLDADNKAQRKLVTTLTGENTKLKKVNIELKKDNDDLKKEVQEIKAANKKDKAEFRDMFKTQQAAIDRLSKRLPPNTQDSYTPENPSMYERLFHSRPVVAPVPKPEAKAGPVQTTSDSQSGVSMENLAGGNIQGDGKKFVK